MILYYVVINPERVGSHNFLYLDPILIAWVRQAGLTLLAVIFLINHGFKILYSRFLTLQILRGFLAAGSAVLYIIALRYVPLAEVIAVTFIGPFFVILLSRTILKENIDLLTILAMGVAFIGLLLITKPGFDTVHPAIVLVVIEAFLFSCCNIISRIVAKDDSAYTTTTYTGLISIIVLTLCVMLFSEFNSQNNYAIAAVVSVGAAIAEFLFISAFYYSTASTLAPIHYTLIIWGSVFGWLFFSEIPSNSTLLGAAIIILAGSYAVNRASKANISP